MNAILKSIFYFFSAYSAAMLAGFLLAPMMMGMHSGFAAVLAAASFVAMIGSFWLAKAEG